MNVEKPNPPDLEAQETIDSTAGTVVNTNDTVNELSYDFVDYTPPEMAKILPPAKYKLCLLIIVLVLIAVWLADEANVVEFLMFGGWLSPQAALFVFLGITVFVLTYGALDLLVAVFTFRINYNNTKNNGRSQPKIVGIGAWLKAPRITWMYRYQNVLMEILAVVIRILEDGFRMFDAPPPCPRNGAAETIPTRCKDPCGETADGCRQKVLKIEHRIDPSKIQDYNKWEDRIAKLLNEQATGLIGYEKQPYKDKDGNEIEFVFGQDGTICNDDSSTENIGGLLRVIKLTFQDIDCLNEWMVLPKRKFVMDDLQPFLVVPDVIQIRLNRELPDAFTDLMIRQGESVPNLPPLKWKVWWLTTVALYLSITWVGSFMAHYNEFWGLIDKNVRIQDLVNIPIVVFVNTYILVPLLLFVFHHWTKRTQVEAKVKKEPWRTLYNGFQSIWWKTLLTFAYYGGMAIAWIVMAK